MAEGGADIHKLVEVAAEIERTTMRAADIIKRVRAITSRQKAATVEALN